MTDKSNKTKKVKDMSKSEREAYEKQQVEYRKTNEFFVEAAEKRVNAVLRGLERIGYLGRYAGNDDQKNKIVESLKIGMENMENDLFKRKVGSNRLKL